MSYDHLPCDDEGTPLPLRLQPGYYAGFSVMDQQAFWDEKTRTVVRARLENIPEFRFFSITDVQFWTHVFEHILPQADRAPERRIPILPRIDERLFTGKTAGYRFADMPRDGDAYTLGRTAINAEATLRYGGDFGGLSYADREYICSVIASGKPQAEPGIWQQMSVQRFWQLLVSDAAEAYYAHPWAWDEIGFGGPAYPRGYMRLENGEPEPWEIQEQRYTWQAPAQCLSDMRLADAGSPDA